MSASFRKCNGRSSSSANSPRHNKTNLHAKVKPLHKHRSLHDKKLSALMKKLNAIEALKMRQAGGENLEVSQVSKMELDDQVSNELDALDEEVEKRNILLLIGHYSLIIVSFDPHRHVSQLFMNSTLLGYMANGVIPLYESCYLA